MAATTPPKPEFVTAQWAATVRDALLKRHAVHLRDTENFTAITGEADADAWILRIVLENQDRSFHLPVEAVLVAADNPDVDTDDARHVLADFIDYFFGEYFRGGRDVTLPIDFKAFTFGEFQIRARGWEKNLMLEEMADRLLAGESFD